MDVLFVYCKVSLFPRIMIMSHIVTPQYERLVSLLFRNPSRRFDISKEVEYTNHANMKNMKSMKYMNKGDAI